MNKEFEFSDFYFLNDINVNNRMSSEELSALYESMAKDSVPDQLIEISDASDKEHSVVYTYAKFLEILDTKGLAGLVNA